MKIGVRALGTACAVLAASILSLEAAVAEPADFVRCDGYGAPNKRGDGMTKVAIELIGFFVPPHGRGDRSRHDVSSRAVGLAACDRALGDPVLLAPVYLARAAS